MTQLSSSELYLIEQITLVKNQLNRYVSIFIFLFGTIGNFLNILVLSQRTLRMNTCAWLFLISSISNLISILFGLTLRIFSGWSFDLTETVALYCKIRAFVMFTSRTIALWLLLFATIDRWVSSLSNAAYRHMSTLKTAKISCFIISCLSLCLYIHTIYCYEANLHHTPLKCYGKTRSCRLLTDITYACFTICLPLILMIIFGLLTISNIHHQSQLITSSINYKISYKKQQQWKKLDHHLRQMLFLQILLIIILTLPQTIHKLYSTLTDHFDRTIVQERIDELFYNFELLLSYIASGMPFYIYTLAGGRIFRKALKKLFCH